MGCDSEKKIIIYGTNLQAQQLKAYIEEEWGQTIAGFVVDREYKKQEKLLDRPVVCFENILKIFPPEYYQIILSFGYKNMVRNRKEKYDRCKCLGYTVPSFISKNANVYTTHIGEGTIIYPGVTIGPYVKIGLGNFFEISTTIAHHTEIGDFNFFAPKVAVSGNVTIGDHCFFGISSVILNNICVADLSLIGAGVVLDCDTKEGEAFRHLNAIRLHRHSTAYL